MTGNRKPKIVKLQKTNQTDFSYHPLCSKCNGVLTIGSRVVSRNANTRRYYHLSCAEDMDLL